MRNFKNFILEIAVFFCGAVVMVYELVGSRVLAPYLGNSIYSWTSLIGVILMSLSAGYYLGGRLADRKKASLEILSVYILIAAVFVTITLMLNTPLLYALEMGIRYSTFSLGVATFFAAVLLFAPASFFLGMVTPYTVKLKISSLDHAGQTVGNLYALSTFGSIFGTFAAGYLLIPFLGTSVLLAVLAISLLAVSVLVAPANLKKTFYWPFLAVVLVGITLFFYLKAGSSPNIVDLDTPYNRFWITENTYGPAKRPVRWLMNNPFGVQTSIYLDNPSEPVAPYIQLFTLGQHFTRNPKSILLIGGGGFSYANYHQLTLPETDLDIVEIDSKLTEIAEKYFFFKPSPRIKIYNEDGRTFINNSSKKYDIILLDAFTSIYSIPYQLTTREAVQKYSDLLNPDGAIMVNLIGAFDGDKARFLQAEYRTFASVFPQVYLFQEDKPKTAQAGQAEKLQGIILLALKSDNKPDFRTELKYGELLNNLWQEPVKTNLPILTDDYAPVDYYLEKIIQDKL